MHVATTIFFLHAHFWEFFFGEVGKHFYEGNVYGNLVAIIPTGLLLFAYIRSRHLAVIESHKALKAAHVEHAVKLEKILDALDPETDSKTQIDRIAELADDQKPGGVTVVLEELRKRKS
jgi:hypothetical protein